MKKTSFKGGQNMLTSIEVGEKKFWLEYVIKTKKKVKEYQYDDSTKIVEIDRQPEKIEIWGVYEYGEIATAALRLVDELYNKHNLGRDEVLKKLKDFYGLNEQDAKELLDYAEWYLFNG